jgi:hypothetical protein
MNAPTPNDRDSGLDEALKDQLKATLPQGTDEGTDALQARVLGQWRQAHPAGGVVASSGPAGALQAAWRQHPVLWTGALAALLLGMWMLRPAQDPVLEELMQPDVLTLISSGEL